MPEPTRRESARRRPGRSTALLIASVLLLVAALGAGAAAVVVRLDTSDLQDRTESVTRQVRALTANEQHAERRLRTLRARGANVTGHLVDLLAASRAQVDASNHAVDVANQAVEQYNRAQTGLAAAFQGAGDAAIADLERKAAAVSAAVAAAQQALTALGQVSRG